MKKTLSIHLGRQLFTIEEDAYDRLQAYLKQLEGSLAGEEGVSEILEDIEMRCAELLQEQLTTKSRIVISMAEIEHAIVSLGEPEVISEDAPKQGQTDNRSEDKSTSGQRRLFRDTENGTLGGVCTGIASYVHVDPVIIKILFIMALFLGFGFFLYIVLWIVLPNVKTPSDRLQLRGVPVTVDNIKDEINKTASRIKDDTINAGNRLRNNDHVAEKARGIINILGKLMAIGFLVSSICWLIGFTLVTSGVMDVFPVTGDQEYATCYDYMSLFIPKNRALGLMWNSIMITGYAAPLFGIILGIRILTKKKSRFFTYSFIILPIVFTAGVMMAIVAGVQTGRDFAVETEKINEQLTIDAKTLNLKEITIYHNNKEVINSGGIDFIEVENGRIIESGVYIKTRPSADSLYHVYQNYSASGVDKKSSGKRSGRITHKMQVVGSTLEISPNYSYPLKDGVRSQSVEIIIEVPLGKTLTVQGNPLLNLNQEHYGMLSHHHNFDFWTE